MMNELSAGIQETITLRNSLYPQTLSALEAFGLASVHLPQFCRSHIVDASAPSDLDPFDVINLVSGDRRFIRLLIDETGIRYQAVEEANLFGVNSNGFRSNVQPITTRGKHIDHRLVGKLLEKFFKRQRIDMHIQYTPKGPYFFPNVELTAFPRNLRVRKNPDGRSKRITFQPRHTEAGFNHGKVKII